MTGIKEWIDDQFDDNPYRVPAEQRLDRDDLDPNSVADRNGTDLSHVDPEAGEIVDLTTLDD